MYLLLMVVLAVITPKDFLNHKITSKNKKNVIRPNKIQLEKMLNDDRERRLRECPVDYPIKTMLKKSN